MHKIEFECLFLGHKWHYLGTTFWEKPIKSEMYKYAYWCSRCKNTIYEEKPLDRRLHD